MPLDSLEGDPISKGGKVKLFFILSYSFGNLSITEQECLNSLEVVASIARYVFRGMGGGGGVAQAVERTTPGQEVPGLIPAVAAAPYWLGRCQYNVIGWDRNHGLPTLSCVWQHLKLSDVSLGARWRYSLVVEEDFKKPTKQTKTKPMCFQNSFCDSHSG